MPDCLKSSTGETQFQGIDRAQISSKMSAWIEVLISKRDCAPDLAAQNFLSAASEKLKEAGLALVEAIKAVAMAILEMLLKTALLTLIFLMVTLTYIALSIRITDLTLKDLEITKEGAHIIKNVVKDFEGPTKFKKYLREKGFDI